MHKGNSLIWGCHPLPGTSPCSGGFGEALLGCLKMGSQAHSHGFGLPAAPPGAPVFAAGVPELSLVCCCHWCLAEEQQGLLVWGCASLDTTGAEPTLEEPQCSATITRGNSLNQVSLNPFLCLLPVILAANTGLSQ